jgi:hypothetical protein
MKMICTKRTIQVLGLNAFLACGASSAFAQSAPPGGVLGSAQYTIYTGDVNGDGQMDLLARAKSRIVIIPYDPPFPVPVRPPSPTFVLLSSGSTYTLNGSPSISTVRSSVWQAGGYALLYGDFAGNGNSGMLIRDTSAGGTTFSITSIAGTGPQLLQAMTSSTLGVDLGASNVTTELADQDGDGRADLLVRTGGRVTAVLLADANGLFNRTDGDPVMAAWFGMLSSLSSGNQGDALQYISPAIRDTYQQAFTNMGSAATALRATLTNLSGVQISDRFATYVVDQTTNGVVRMHFVQFINVDGVWMLDSF